MFDLVQFFCDVQGMELYLKKQKSILHKVFSDATDIYSWQ